MATFDQQAQDFLNYKGRLLNHVEMVYRPGERHLVTKLFTALGCTVIDTGATHLVYRSTSQTISHATTRCTRPK